MDPFMVSAVTQLAHEEGWEMPPPRRRLRRAIARLLRRAARSIEPLVPPADDAER
ncbi:hypothetical protein [Microbacterium sp. G2-8]|uniref:hypothetical protein n=1 Tax=Microbacterium sp. G2-8 TaxID=2842454 RepID=UPI001C89ADAA|nr:hypothetical protein [Microbacterium sp. G2-8]